MYTFRITNVMKKCFGKQIENIDFGNAQTTHCRQNVFDQTKQSLKQSTQQPRKIVNDNETKH